MSLKKVKYLRIHNIYYIGMLLSWILLFYHHQFYIVNFALAHDTILLSFIFNRTFCKVIPSNR